MAIFKSSNHTPNLQEVDLNNENEFSCQINTSGESVRAYKLQILSSRGDEIIRDGIPDSIDSNYRIGKNLNYPIKNKGFLKFNINDTPNLKDDNSLENGKDYQWGIRTYTASIGSSEQPKTLVCEGFMVGSTQYVIWVNLEGADADSKKIVNDNLQYNRYIEFNIQEDKIEEYILPFSKNYNDDKKYPPELNNYDKTAYTKRQKIDWVEKDLGKNKNITKIECEDNFDYNYKDGTPFKIYLCSDQHTPNSIFVDPNDEIDLSNYIVIYNNEEDYNKAKEAKEDPSTKEPTVTPRNKARKIYGYSSDTGEIRVHDPFDPVPVNGNYYRIFEYDVVNKKYEEKTNGEVIQVVGGSPIENNYFKVYSNVFDSSDKSNNRLFIQPNINIKTDHTNPNEIVFDDGTRVDIIQKIDPNANSWKNSDITFDKLDNTQWLLKGDCFDLVSGSGDLSNNILPKTNYSVYTDFIDSSPYNIFYAREKPELKITYTNLNKEDKESSGIIEDVNEFGNVSYRDIYFRTAWKNGSGNIPKQNIKYYKYSLYDEDGELIDQSENIYSTELFEYNNEYVTLMTWSFKGLESGKDINSPKLYNIKLLVVDEYNTEFLFENNLKVFYEIENDYLPLNVDIDCEEKAIKIFARAPEYVDSTDYINEDGITKSTVDGNDIKAGYSPVDNGFLSIPENEVLNYTTTVGPNPSPIIISENMSLLTRFQITGDFMEEIEENGEKEILSFANKRYLDKNKVDFVIDVYSLKIGGFTGYYKTENGKYIKNSNQLKLRWYKNGELLQCFDGNKDYKDLRDIKTDRGKYSGFIGKDNLKLCLQEQGNLKIIQIPELIVSKLNNSNVYYYITEILKEEYPECFINGNVIDGTQILLQDTFDSNGNNLTSNLIDSGIYIYKKNELGKYSWEYDLTTEYIYADDLDDFVSDDNITLDSLGVPQNCRDLSNENTWNWIEEGNVWIDNYGIDEIIKRNKQLLNETWFVLYFISNNAKNPQYYCELQIIKEEQN